MSAMMAQVPGLDNIPLCAVFPTLILCQCSLTTSQQGNTIINISHVIGAGLKMHRKL
mgnify:CR=1 FL=1